MIRLIISTVILLFFEIAISQEILWERSIGGDKSEYLYDMKPTPDNGFILAGSSYSDKSGNKTDDRKGDLDYFIWKMDKNGHQEWQRSLGGSGADYLYSINLTREGGYILGGSSNSPKDGDKKSEGFGLHDFWVIKLDPNGDEEWQFTIGGKGMDILLSIQQTKDKGYILGGTSDSSKGKNLDENPYQKSEDSRGGMDYWVVKITEFGEIEWQKAIGGEYYDVLRSIHQTEDEGYILGGYSNSPASNEKTDDNQGDGDFWIVKLDKKGNIEWDKTIGGDGDDELFALILTSDNGYMLGGNSNSNISGSKQAGKLNGTDWWVIKLDEFGEIIWQNTYDIGRNDVLRNIMSTKTNEFILSGYATSEKFGEQESEGIEDFVVVKIDDKGQEIWRKYIGGDGVDYLESTVLTRDGGYVLAGSSTSNAGKDKDSKANGREDYWIVKLLDDKNKDAVKIEMLEVYPNPSTHYVNVLVNADFTEADLQIYDMLGSVVIQSKLVNRLTPLNIRQLKTGSYVLKVTIENQVFTKKIIKK